MDDKQKIKITIANRVYPLSVKSEREEESLRLAAKKIAAMVSKFEKNYAVGDKQDVLAMCALQFASELEFSEINERYNHQESVKKLEKLNEILGSYL
ncbi:cell division protein ZapA [Aureivirga sp. CE67]|uniref:cell division protein ZapA n=1 Tax=Aureivirga sp. CE67 TaxID=1788983 RepID=UPI0018CBCC77|nr:cell division protein ZapA [Aureivirga sp. CE67]